MIVHLGGIVEDIAAAIERQEGVGCRLGNNPGALRTWGNLPTSGGFAQFPTCDAGRQALQRQVQLNIDRGLTLQEFFGGKPGVYGGYAPAADRNQPDIYAAHVSEWTGIPADVPLDEWDGETGGGYYIDDGETPDSSGDATNNLAAAAGIAAAAFILWRLL